MPVSFLAPDPARTLAAPKRTFASKAPARVFLLKATGLTMPRVGDFSAVDAAEIVSLSIDFANELATGDSITACSGALTAYDGADSNAPNLVVSAATFSGTVVTQIVGPGFVPGVVYQWWANAGLASGLRKQLFGFLPCTASASPNPLPTPSGPATTTQISTNATISATGVYEIMTAGLTLTLASGAGSIDLSNPEVEAGVTYLGAQGLIASGRAATILAGAPHP